MVAERVGISAAGERFPGRIQAFPVLNESGRANHFMEVVKDISPERAAREAVLKGKAHPWKIFENTNAGLVTLDPRGRCSFGIRQSVLLHSGHLHHLPFQGKANPR